MIAAWLLARGIAPRVALIGVIVLALGLVALAWRSSVSDAVADREARARAAILEKARKADTMTAAQQRRDDARLGAERNELQKGAPHDSTPLSDTDRRNLRCIRLQQDARANGKPAPSC